MDSMTTEQPTPFPLEQFGIHRNAEGKFLAPSGGDAPLRTLFRGTAKAPDLSRGPTPDLEPFFMFLESTVITFCDLAGRDETDQEMHRIYTQLRRRPDGKDCLLYTFIQAAARVYMLNFSVSQDEYEAVMGRLAKSAKTFSIGHISRNYLDTIRGALPLG